MGAKAKPIWITTVLPPLSKTRARRNTKADRRRVHQAAKTAYDASFETYKATSRSADRSAIEALITQTYNTTKLIADTLKDANTLIQFYKDTLSQYGVQPVSLADTHLNTLNQYIGTAAGNDPRHFPPPTTSKTTSKALPTPTGQLRKNNKACSSSRTRSASWIFKPSSCH